MLPICMDTRSNTVGLLQLTMSRIEEVKTAIRSRIAARALSAGDRLPSIREMAASLGCSPSTVVEAYDRLAAEGLIRARRGSGFYVGHTTTPRLNLSSDSQKQDRAVDPFWVSRQSLDAESSALKPGCGWLPPDWMPEDALRRAFRSVAKTDAALLMEYGSTRGSLNLRNLLLRRCAEDGLEPDNDQILLTGSGTQSIDLICRLLLRPGDSVLIDDPCYFNFRALLQAHQVNVIGIPYTQSGPDAAAFEQAVAREERPRLYITNSAIHNPTGATMAPSTAYRIVSAAALHDLAIVEDDIFTDFEPEPSVRLAALDGLNRVIRIGSFSKTLSASVRCGYIVARKEWIEGLVDLQVATSFGGPSPIAAELISQVLSGGSYRKHMEEVRQRLTRRRREIAAQLAKIGVEPWLMPRGGFYLWCKLPDVMDSAAIAQRALERNIVLAPGNVFSASQTFSSFIRINVAQTDARIVDGIQQSFAAL